MLEIKKVALECAIKFKDSVYNASVGVLDIASVFEHYLNNDTPTAVRILSGLQEKNDDRDIVL